MIAIFLSVQFGSVLRKGPKMRSRFSVASMFSAWFGILLWAGEAAGFCASVFEINKVTRHKFLCS